MACRHFTLPLPRMFLHASSDMTDSLVANLFKSIGCSDQLLRIQVNNIPIVSVSADLAMKKNLQGLVKIVENLLQRPRSKDDCKINHGRANAKSTADLLTWFAKLLSDERKLTLQNIELDVRVLANHERGALQNMWSMPILAIRVDYYIQSVVCILVVL